MPPITRSRDELARIVALLDSDAYDTAEALAYAVLKEAADIIADRHLFVLVSKTHPDVAWGPYYTEAQAEKAWRVEIGPVLGTEGGTGLRVAPWPAEPAKHEDKDYHPRSVCHCGHQRWRHTNGGKRQFCGNRKDQCRCPGFQMARA